MKGLKETKELWGTEKHFAINKKCSVKLLTVNPGEELSLQSHKHRQENWYFLDSATAVVGDKKFKVKPGDYLKIKKRQKHRVIGGKNPARFIEVSFGKFDKKDEIRWADKYGRATVSDKK
jgi:mannose-6-phosphate isomerase-like protein (cupin superfamily)